MDLVNLPHFDELFEAFARCARSGWDGEDACPIAVTTFATARDFLASLPVAFPGPEVAPLEDGAIALD